MISYKALIILTVLFDTIIYCNGSLEECVGTLLKIGFESDTGFYNLNFVLQFRNDDEFIEHAKTRLAITNTVYSPEEHDYLIKFFKKIYSEKPDNYEDIILKTPAHFCTVVTTQSELKVSVPSNEFEEIKPQLIEKCTKSILAYRHVNGDTVFKFDETNRYKNLLTIYDMVVLNNPEEEKAKLFKNMLDVYKIKEMQGTTHKYYLYNIKIFEILFDTFDWFTPRELCKNYFSNENKEVLHPH